jgi:hypothetical protein
MINLNKSFIDTYIKKAFEIQKLPKATRKSPPAAIYPDGV